MWIYPDIFDVIVIGAGHAGCEAVLAAGKIGVRALLLTTNLDSIAKMSCNPAIGGIAKGHIVREIDALGGEMGKATDRTAIQFRMLNASKGPAVWAPRAQSDRFAYQMEMKSLLERAPNVFVKQGSVESLLIKSNCVEGVSTREGVVYQGKTIILSSGTFMRGLLHLGETSFSGGRSGDESSEGLSTSLKEHGFNLGRLKTGTPPRVNRRSIDFSKMEEQRGDEGVRFSFDDENGERLTQVPCYITYTTLETREIIKKNLHRSPMYSGKIESVGPRYCPSIEDKIVRFPDKDRHQVFLEPESLSSEEMYVNGVSTSLPFDVQLSFIRSIIGMENAEIMRSAYAIEYDYVKSGQIQLSLETKDVEGLFFAGQINGTTGYEEAAAQGLIAGINAANRVLGRPPFFLKRSEAYIGVLIDDLVTKGVDEPYRMFTSRAEYRLLLRQDNADLRLRKYGYEQGLVDRKRYEKLCYKEEVIKREMARFSKVFKQMEGKGVSLAQLLRRPEVSYENLLRDYPEDVQNHSHEINKQIELNLKFSGYIHRQENEAAKLQCLEKYRIPSRFDFSLVKGLRFEAVEKLSKVSPINLEQASRISGVSPSDISILMIALSS